MSDDERTPSVAPVSAGLPRLRHAAARHVAALALRHRRCGPGGAGLDRPPPRGRAELVAGAAAGTHRLRRLAVSIPVVVRRQRAADQPGLADRGWIAAGERLRGAVVSVRPRSTTTPSFLFKHRLLETAWANFSAGARADLRPAFEQFCAGPGHWLDDYALFRALKARYERRSLSRVAGRAGPPRAGGAGRRPGGNWRARSIRSASPSSCCSARAARLKAACARQGRAPDRRPAVLRLPGLERRVGATRSCSCWTSSAGRASSPVCRPTISAPQGQLWGNPVYDWDALRADRLPLVDRPAARPAGPRRRDSPGSFPRVRGGLARAGRSADGPNRPLGARARAPISSVPCRRSCGALPFIAEDLGLITPDVSALRDRFELPGTRVLQFAFDGHADNPYLPDNYVANTVVYTGTHDNPTTRGWFEDCRTTSGRTCGVI